MELLTEPIVMEFIFLFVGLILGSFATLLIHRLYYDEPGIVSGRSRCPQCREILSPISMIPVFSWLFQQGKCKRCGKKIPVFYPLVELSFGISYFMLARFFGGEPAFWWLFGILFFLLVLFWYDVRFMIVDRRISIPAILLAIAWAVYNWFTGAQDLISVLGGGILIGGFFFVQFFYSRKKAQPWVGAGDTDMGLFLGLCLGLKLGLLSLFVAYIIGTVYAIGFIVWKIISLGPSSGKKKSLSKVKVPMGAFLMPSLWLFLFFGEQIWTWYWDVIIL